MPEDYFDERKAKIAAALEAEVEKAKTWHKARSEAAEFIREGYNVQAADGGSWIIRSTSYSSDKPPMIRGFTTYRDLVEYLRMAHDALHIENAGPTTIVVQQQREMPYDVNAGKVDPSKMPGARGDWVKE